MSKSSYALRQDLQSAQYTRAYHWDDRKRVENDKYLRMTSFIFDLAIENFLVGAVGDKHVQLLDVGCGDGRSSYLLWRHFQNTGYSVRVIGVDVDRDAIHWARQKTRHVDRSQLDFVVGDARDIAKDCSTSVRLVVVLREVIEHLEERQIDDLFEVLSSFGQYGLIVTVPSINSPVEPKHFRHYDKKKLGDVLERNNVRCIMLTGFAYRPRALYSALRRAKSLLNRVPVIWRLMSFLWRPVSPSNAMTLVAVGEKSGRHQSTGGK